MLDLNTAERIQLKSNGSLCHDAEGNEALIGLTARESIFVLRYQKIFDDRRSSAHQHAYLQLRQRHAHACNAVQNLRDQQRLMDVESALDLALADSFPASDPTAISITKKAFP
ncbi:hypothetical protein SAMN05216319_2045 [Duganella sp. CF402]|uniref:hypothetical protein n=1 Tax=unclassified Duganella TaxID=2636909 RepID=UPI0008C5EDCD|nr:MULTISPECIES: hypothetical protein [unclassified Duganella]RZT09525.1 hypothetical protein EV582_1578 [Duganella sp. BK701]SEL53956.1 hypothetical protein SAMN05216319_2045 [Duganella sp. CF402]